VARWAEVRVRPVLRLAGDTEIPDFPGFGRPEYVARWAEVRVRPVLRLAGDVVTPCLWELEPKRIELARRSLDQISRWWDEKLAALKASVEDER
ncbi:MAG: transcriptional regulator, partial [Dehalococcoidia bacterium]